MNKKYDEKIEINKTKEVKQKKSMADEIKEDINDTTFLEKNILKDNQEYDKKLFEKKNKKIRRLYLRGIFKILFEKRRKKTRRRREKKKRRRRKKKQKRKKKKSKDEDEEIKDEKIDEMMEIDKEFGKEVEKELNDDENSEEETKIDLNEENQDIIDIIDKIFMLKRFEKEKIIDLYFENRFQKKRKKKKSMENKF